MANKTTKHTEGALKYAKDQLGDLVTGVQFIGTLDGIECFEPVFIDSPAFGVGLPFFILLKNGEYKITTEEEYDRFISLC